MVFALAARSKWIWRGRRAKRPLRLYRQKRTADDSCKLPRDRKFVDGPIMGNGDVGIAMGGPPEQQRFYIGKNDFWSQQAFPLTVGGMQLTMVTAQWSRRARANCGATAALPMFSGGGKSSSQLL